jgi:hypothetical protein
MSLAQNSIMHPPQGRSALERLQEAANLKKVTWWPALFVILLAVPNIVDVGSLRLSPYRIFLLVALFAGFIGWMFGKAGPKRPADYFIILFTLWCQIALVAADGFSISIEPIGMLAIETLGAYFLGRTFIRSKYQFWHMCKWYMIVLIVLLPFAIGEALFERVFILELFGNLSRVHDGVFFGYEGRWGMRRAQASFEHPILYGLFASYGVGFFGYGMELKNVGFMSTLRMIIPFLNVFFSLSTGSYLAVITQWLMMGYEFVTRKIAGRWKILLGVFVVAYVLVDNLSNRSPFEVFVSYLTFDQATSYNRVLIWKFGTQQIWQTPLFGIGETGDWIRPWWMHPSMDNFWLLQAVKYGLPAFVLLMLFVYFVLRDIGKAKLVSRDLMNIRLGWMFAIISMFIAICSVHLWNATYCFMIFLLGGGLWMADVDDRPEQENEQANKGDGERGKRQNFRPAIRPAPEAASLMQKS